MGCGNCTDTQIRICTCQVVAFQGLTAFQVDAAVQMNYGICAGKNGIYGIVGTVFIYKMNK